MARPAAEDRHEGVHVLNAWEGGAVLPSLWPPNVGREITTKRKLYGAYVRASAIAVAHSVGTR